MIKRCPASLDYLHEMLRYVRLQVIERNLFIRDIYPIELAVEEALVNIINYAYPNKTGDIQIECLFDNENQIAIVITDEGIPYNPLNPGRNVDHSHKIENKEIGGYGIFFILRMMDEVRYSNEKGKNILTLVKYISTI